MLLLIGEKETINQFVLYIETTSELVQLCSDVVFIVHKQ